MWTASLRENFLDKGHMLGFNRLNTWGKTKGRWKLFSERGLVKVKFQSRRLFAISSGKGTFFETKSLALHFSKCKCE